MSIYAPLQARLVNASSAPLTLSYQEIERLIGRRLPKSAYDQKIKRQWWANTDTHAQARAWLRAGRKAKVDVQRNEVTFSPIDDEAPTGKVQLSGAARQLIRQTAEAAGVSESEAMILALNEAAMAKRRAIFAWFEENGRPTLSSSVDLIREDRDAR